MNAQCKHCTLQSPHPAPPTAHSLHHHTLCSPPDLTPARTRGTPPAEPTPPTRAGCLFSPYPRNRRTMPRLRSPPDLTPPLAHLYPAAPLLRPALTALPGGKSKTHPPAEPVPAAPAPPASANVHTSSHPTAPGESPPERNVVSSSHPPSNTPPPAEPAPPTRAGCHLILLRTLQSPHNTSSPLPLLFSYPEVNHHPPCTLAAVLPAAARIVVSSSHPLP